MINIPCYILPLFFLSFCCCFQGTKHRLRSHRCRQTISVCTASSSGTIPSRIVFLWEVATPTTVLIWYDDATITEIYPSEKSGKLSARETLVTDLDQGSYDMSYMSGHDAFADINNLDHCIKYLNQSLFMFGFPSALDLYSSEPASIVQTCNCIYAMIQQRQRDIEYRETVNDTRQRLMSDMSRLEAKVERLTDQLGSKERELQALTSKEQKAAAAHKAQLERLQHEKDESQRMVISTQQVRIQQTHELKKKEKEFIKLQERLIQALQEKKKESKTGMEIMNLLQKEGRQRGTWLNKKADGDFYKMIVDAYEAQKQELIAENTDLRNMLRSMQGDMNDLNISLGLELPHTHLGGNLVAPVQDIFDLPFHMARDQIEQSLQAGMTSIKECMVQLQKSQKHVKITES